MQAAFRPKAALTSLAVAMSAIQSLFIQADEPEADTEQKRRIMDLPEGAYEVISGIKHSTGLAGDAA